MEDIIHLSTEENQALAQLLARYTERAKHTITLSYLMDKWSRFVTNVENEYRLTIDDYTNSLSGRKLIQGVLDTCPANIELKEWVVKWDDRFMLVTQIVNEPLLPSWNDEKLGWWWFRIPINPGRRLKEWFELDGVE